MAWPSEDQLKRNEELLLRELRHRVSESEARHGMSSDLAQELLHSGALEETGDICRWMIDWDALTSLERAQN